MAGLKHPPVARLSLTGSTRRAMDKFVLGLVFLHGLVCLAAAQHHVRARIGPWRQRIQWENNGQVYSLLSTGTRYRSAAQDRRRTQLLVTTRHGPNRFQPPPGLRRSTRTRSGDLQDAARGRAHRNDVSHTDVSVLGADAGQYLLASGRAGRPSHVAPHMATPREAVGHRLREVRWNGSSEAAVPVQEFSGSGVPRGGRSSPGEAAASPVRSPDFTHRRGGRINSISESSESPATSGWVTVAEGRGNARASQQTGPGGARTEPRVPPRTRITPESSVRPTALSRNAIETHSSHTVRTTDRTDPREPDSVHHRNSVLYNLYPPDPRNRITVRPPPGPGHGTTFFHNGEAARTDKYKKKFEHNAN